MEISEPWREMLAHFAGNDSAAALDGVAADLGLCFELPMIEKLGGAALGTVSDIESPSWTL